VFFDIRTAALDDLVEQRVRLAVSLLGAYRLRAKVGPWDGTRCHLLIASSDDAYGQQALSLAQRRGTSLIPLGETESTPGIATISAYTPAAALAKLIHERLQGEQPQPAAIAPASATLPALCRLATPPLRGHAVDATCHHRKLMLRPQVGRVYARTHSDLLAVADSLSGSDWEMTVVDRPDSTENMVSASLEAFLVRAAHRASDRLPDFPEGRYRLDAWPDLGSLPSMLGAMQASKLLIGNTLTLRELKQSAPATLDRAELNACLWAFAAADLLRDTAPSAGTIAAPARPARMQAGLWSSLARRFGLLRA